jgi:hypothetical protein
MAMGATTVVAGRLRRVGADGAGYAAGGAVEVAERVGGQLARVGVCGRHAGRAAVMTTAAAAWTTDVSP